MKKQTNERKSTSRSNRAVSRNISKPRNRRKASNGTGISRILTSKLWPDLGYPEVDYPSSDYQRKYET